MTDTEIFENVKRIIHKQFEIDEEKIEEDSYFDSDLNISDLDMEDLLLTIQSKYDIVIPDEHIPSFKKISDLVTHIFENANQSA